MVSVKGWKKTARHGAAFAVGMVLSAAALSNCATTTIELRPATTESRGTWDWRPRLAYIAGCAFGRDGSVCMGDTWLFGFPGGTRGSANPRNSRNVSCAW